MVKNPNREMPVSLSGAGEFEPRPSAIIEQTIYMFSCLIWISPA